MKTDSDGTESDDVGIPLVMTRDLTTSEMARATGMSFRQLDYLVRSDLLRPKQIGGRGNPRRWGQDQIRQVRFAAVLREHGATEQTLRPAMRSAEELQEGAWQARVLVTLEGRITTLLAADANGWMIDLALCRDRADRLALLAA